MYSNIKTKEELKNLANFEKRKQFETDRKYRIFNPKQRILGIDTNAIKKQIKEKKDAVVKTLEKDQKYFEEEQKQVQILKNKETQYEREKHRKLLDVQYYRDQFQRKYSNKSPNNIVQYGILSAQKFEGEDLTFKQRQKKQKEQQKAWLDQQIQERVNAEQNNRNSNKLSEQRKSAEDCLLMQLLAKEQSRRIRRIEDIQKYNRDMASVQKTKKQEEKLKEEADNKAEITNILTSSFLNENFEISQSSLGPNRKIPYMYKGMTSEELDCIRREQQRQLQEKKINKLALAKCNLGLDKNTKAIAQIVNNRFDNIKEKQKKTLKLQQEENRMLAEEQKKRQQNINRIYSNEIRSEFYSQFNTSTR